MIGFRNRQTAHGGSPEKRAALRGSALMAAVGLCVSALITVTPRWFARAVSVNAAAQADAGGISDFYRKDSLILLSLPELEAEKTFVSDAFAEAPILLQSTEIDDYISVIGAAEANTKVRAINERKEREARAKAQREAMLAQQQALVEQGGFVRFNRQGVPISQKTGFVELDANGVPTHYSRCITGTATAYYGGTSTATGTRPMQGSVAVNPKQIPYGTRMWITSADGSIVYGLGVAEDTGGFIYLSKGPVVDLYFNLYEDCVSWGLRYVNIYILD